MDTNVKTIIERTPCVSDNDEIYHNTSEETNTFTLMISVNRNDKKDIEVMGGGDKIQISAFQYIENCVQNFKRGENYHTFRRG